MNGLDVNVIYIQYFLHSYAVSGRCTDLLKITCDISLHDIEEVVEKGIRIDVAARQ